MVLVLVITNRSGWLLELLTELISIEGMIMWVERGGKRKSEGATGSDSSQGGTVGLWNNDCEQ